MKTLEDVKVEAVTMLKSMFREESTLRHCIMYNMADDGSDEATVLTFSGDIEPGDMPHHVREKAFEVNAYCAFIMSEAWASTQDKYEEPIEPRLDPNNRNVVSCMINHPEGYANVAIEVTEKNGVRVWGEPQWMIELTKDEGGEACLGGRMLNLIPRGNAFSELHTILSSPNVPESLVNFMERTVLRQFRPDWASPPGDTIKDCLEVKGMSKEDFATAMGLTNNEVDQLLEGRMRVKSILAEKLASTLGSTLAFWLRRDRDFVYAAQNAAFFKNLVMKEIINHRPNEPSEEGR